MKGKLFSCFLNERFMKNDITQGVLIYWESLHQVCQAPKWFEIDVRIV